MKTRRRHTRRRGRGAKMRGGAAASVVPAPAPPGAPVAPPMSRNAFWDALIARATSTWPEKFPPSWDGVLWYMFVLHNLEQLEIIGPLVSTLLDSITLSLPALADLAEDILSNLSLLVPLPYAGLAGQMVGYVVAVVFSLIAAAMSTSRRRYGDAAKAALEIVPALGDVLAQAAQSFEIGAGRYEDNRAKFLASVGRVSPHAANYFGYKMPTIVGAPGADAATAAAPTWDSAAIQANLQTYIAKKTGANKMLGALNAAAASAASKATAAATGAVTNRFTRKGRR